MLEMSELGGNPERSNRIVEPEYNEADTDIEYSLRPNSSARVDFPTLRAPSTSNAVLPCEPFFHSSSFS